MVREILGPDAEAIEQQLRRLLRCSGFDASERNRKFLQFVVDQTLAGHADHIKAYTIATLAFGRGADFDPQQDAIVRIEAGRLRRALEHYYLTAGANDPVRITIPVGSYVPAFAFPAAKGAADGQSPFDETPDSPTGEVREPSILVRAFEAEGDQSAYPNVTRGFTRQIIAGLSRFSGITVYGPELASTQVSDQDQSQVGRVADVDFVLSGGTFLSETEFCVEAVLHDARTGRCIWAQSFDRHIQAGDLSVLRAEVSAQIAGSLAQPYGIIFAFLAAKIDSISPGHSSAPNSMMRFYKYWRSFDTALLGPVIADLEGVLRTDPANADALANLSLACSNTVRFGPNNRAESAAVLLRAQELAQRSISYRPQSSRGYFALAVAFWFLGNVKGSLEALRTAQDLNPNDTEVMAERGVRHACLADWDNGVLLLQEAYRRNPALSGVFRVGLSLWHLASDRYAEAYAEALQVDAPQVVYGLLVEAASAGMLGLTRQAQTAVKQVLQLHPDYPAQIVEDLGFRNVEPRLANKIIRGLEAAGFPQPVSNDRSGLALAPGKRLRNAVGYGGPTPFDAGM